MSKLTWIFNDTCTFAKLLHTQIALYHITNSTYIHPIHVLQGTSLVLISCDNDLITSLRNIFLYNERCLKRVITQPCFDLNLVSWQTTSLIICLIHLQINLTRLTLVKLISVSFSTVRNIITMGNLSKNCSYYVLTDTLSINQVISMGDTTS